MKTKLRLWLLRKLGGVDSSQILSFKNVIKEKRDDYSNKFNNCSDQDKNEKLYLGLYSAFESCLALLELIAQDDPFAD